MSATNIPSYFSQWDGDNGGYTGACGETCLKMVDCYLTGREVPISAIVQNGDGSGVGTTIGGMIKAANWLGFDVDYFSLTTRQDILNWLDAGHLIVVVVRYDKIPALYKQDQSYPYGHFLLLTGITGDKGAIRYADPNFWGARRNEGWYDNNKWIDTNVLWPAFYHNTSAICKNGSALKVVNVKDAPEPVPPPVDDTCKKALVACKASGKKKDEKIDKLSASLADATMRLDKIEKIAGGE